MEKHTENDTTVQLKFNWKLNQSKGPFKSVKSSNDHLNFSLLFLTFFFNLSFTIKSKTNDGYIEFSVDSLDQD